MTDDSRQNVIEILKEKIGYNHIHDKNYLAQKLEQEKKMTLSEFIRIWNGSLPLENLSDTYLCVLYTNLTDIKLSTNYRMPPVSNYFSELEIIESKNIISNNTDLEFPLTFNDVTILNDDHYLIPMSISLINKLQISKILERSVNAQRETVIRIKNNDVYEYIKLNNNSIREIKESLLKREYYPDELKFNLNADGNENIEYDPNTKQLTIYSGHIFVIDGNHRTIAIEQAMYDDPTLDITFPVSFMHFPLWKAQEAINQQEKKRPLLKSVAESYANTPENTIIQMIMNDRNLSSDCRIVKSQRNITAGSGSFLFSILAKAIKETYTEEDIIRFKKETTDWIVEFLNDLPYNISSVFDKKQKNKNWGLSNTAVYFYIYLSKYLKGNTQWRTLLSEILKKIDFQDFSLPYANAKNIKAVSKKMFQHYVIDKEE